MQSEAFETFVGAVVVAICLGFLVYVYTGTEAGAVNGYELKARFGRVDGVTAGSDVRMAGIKIGTVGTLNLDPETYVAIVHMNIRSDVQIPDDSSVKITSESLLGGNYLSIEPGGSYDYLADGGEIAYTQGAVDVMSLISQAIFALSSDTEKKE